MEIDKVLQAYKKNYSRIFENIYPSKNGTGFTERNLSVNFAKAYESLYPDSFTWYEFQFGEKNNLHYDAIIVNPEKKKLVVIESKRFSGLRKKIKEVRKDILRIEGFNSWYYSEFVERIPTLADYSVTGVILADVWTESEGKTALKESFQNGTFLQIYGSNLDQNEEQKCREERCFCLGFADTAVSTIRKNNTIPENYYLLGMIWDIHKKE